MQYVNLETGLTLDLSSLDEEQIKFYRVAHKKFQKNIDWLAFDEFAFGSRSPIYKSRQSHHEVLKDPFYLALKDMSLQLGQQQGRIGRAKVQSHA